MAKGGGLSSYPHPWLMPSFWEVPHRIDGSGADHGHLPGALQRLPRGPGLLTNGSGKVWAFLGDGETDEPEALGAITLAAREQLDNLIFVVNCNLQRLDGPSAGTTRSSRSWRRSSGAPAGT